MNVFASRNTDDVALVSKYASITATFQILLGILGLILGVLLSYNFVDLFKIETINILQIRWVIILLSVSFFITMISQTYTSLLTAYRKIHIDNLIGIITIIINSLLIILFLNYGIGITGMAISILITQCLSTGFSILRVHKYLPDLKINYFKIDLVHFNELFKLGIWFFIGSISVLLIEKFDQILTGKLINIETVAILIITAKLFELVRGLIYSISNNFRPYISKMVGAGEVAKAYKYYVILRKVSILASTLSACIIIYANKAFIEIWVGPSFFGGDLLTIALGFNLIYYCWKLPARVFLTSNLVVKEQSLYGIIEGFINILVSYFLGVHFGLIGIIGGTFISGFLFQLIIYGVLLNNKGLETWSSYISNNLNLLLQTIILIGFSVLMMANFPASGNQIWLLIAKSLFLAISLLTFLVLFNISDFKILYSFKFRLSRLK